MQRGSVVGPRKSFSQDVLKRSMQARVSVANFWASTSKSQILTKHFFTVDQVFILKKSILDSKIDPFRSISEQKAKKNANQI